MNEQWYDPENKADNHIIKEVSPAFHVDKVTKPLFVIQGQMMPG